jgi:uncharacterized protein (TIGR02246 family)
MTPNQSSAPEAIRRTNQQFMEAARRGDAAGMAAVCTEQGRILPPSAAARTGRDAIREFWQVVVWQRGNGAWKWHRDIWNSSRDPSS